MALQLQVEVAGPHERQHCSRETPDQAHQDREVGDGNRHHNSAEDDADSECQPPHSEFPVQMPYRREHRFRLSFKKRFLQNVARGVVRQRIREEGFDNEDEIDHASEPGRREVVGYDLLRVVLEGQEADVAEDRLEYGGGDVAPVEHPLELGPVDQVALQGGEEDLRRVGEDDDAKRDGEVLEVQSPLDLAPAPLGQVQQTVAEDDDVDGDVRHSAPEAEHGHVVQRLEEPQRDQQDADEHHPAADVERAVRERAYHQVAAYHHVQDAGHQQLDHLLGEP